MKKRSLIKALTGGLIITASLLASIIYKGKTGFEMGLLLAYLGLGLLGFIYVYLLERLRLGAASSIFLGLSLLAGLYLYFKMPNSPEVFSQLSVFLGWLLLMGLGLVSSLVVGLASYYKRKKTPPESFK